MTCTHQQTEGPVIAHTHQRTHFNVNMPQLLPLCDRWGQRANHPKSQATNTPTLALSSPASVAFSRHHTVPGKHATPSQPISPAAPAPPEGSHCVVCACAPPQTSPYLLSHHVDAALITGVQLHHSGLHQLRAVQLPRDGQSSGRLACSRGWRRSSSSRGAGGVPLHAQLPRW